MGVGVVGLQRPHDLVHHRRLAGAGRRHDQAALAFADRGDQVDQTGGGIVTVAAFEREAFGRMHRHEIVEVGTGGRCVGLATVDGLDGHERRVLLVAIGRTRRAGDHVALAQAVLPDELHRHIGIVTARDVAVHPQEAVALAAEVEPPLGRDRIAVPLLVGLVAVVAVATTPATTTVAGLGAIVRVEAGIAAVVRRLIVVAIGVVVRGLDGVRRRRCVGHIGVGRVGLFGVPATVTTGGQVENEVDDLALAGTRRGLLAQRRRDLGQLVSVFALQRRTTHLRGFHGLAPRVRPGRSSPMEERRCRGCSPDRMIRIPAVAADGIIGERG